MLFEYQGKQILTGVLEPEDIGRVAMAAAQDKLAGASGLVLPHEMVTTVHHEIRAKMGALLQLLPKVYVLDELSKEWLPHLALTGDVGPDAGWLLADATSIRDFAKDRNEQGSHIVTTLLGAYMCALRGINFTLLVQHANAQQWGGMDTSYLPLYRWATRYGANAAVVRTEEEAAAKVGITLDRKLAQAHLEEAAAAWVQAPTEIGSDTWLDQQMAEVLGVPAPPASTTVSPPPPPPSQHFRRLELGSHFDPAKHYDDNYYGVDGRGIQYCTPDGSWRTYRGTAHAWDGNKTIAKWVKGLSGERRKLLDIGTGAGHFVACSRDVGLDAYGVDISDEARKRTPKPLQKFLHVMDVSKQSVDGGPFELITAWDFWEHIFLTDVANLLDGVVDNLEAGGLHFACICTRGEGEQDHTYKFGEVVTPQNSWILVSGHVTIRTWHWWASMFKARGLKLRYDLMKLFDVWHAADPTMRSCESWSARNVLVGEKA
jgi:hypothetical protein